MSDQLEPAGHCECYPRGPHRGARAAWGGDAMSSESKKDSDIVLVFGLYVSVFLVGMLAGILLSEFKASHRISKLKTIRDVTLTRCAEQEVTP